MLRTYKSFNGKSETFAPPKVGHFQPPFLSNLHPPAIARTQGILKVTQENCTSRPNSIYFYCGENIYRVSRLVLGVSSVLKRAVVHVFIGSFIPIAALLMPRIPLVVAVSIMTSVFVAIDLVRKRNTGLNRWFLYLLHPLLREHEISHLTGASYMLLASLIALLAFPRDVAVLALFFLAVGDPMAAIVGNWVGRRKLLDKTLEAELVCFISCEAIGLVFYQTVLDIPLYIVLVGSLCATIAEAIPLPIDDNLTIPLFAGSVMTVLQIW